MINLSTIEIDHFGNILSVITPEKSILEELLPEAGANLLNYWDKETNNRMLRYVNAIFATKGSIVFSLEINHIQLQFTAHHFAPDKAFIYCKPAKAKTPSEIQKEQQLKLVDFAFRNAIIAVLFVSESGLIYDCNEETCRLLGYTKEEFKTLTIADLDPKVDEHYWKNAWIRHQTLVKDVVYTKLKKKDGRLIDVEIKSKYFTYEGLEVLGAFINDITEKKRIEEESYKEKKLLRTLIDHLPFSVFVKDDNARKLVANIKDVEYMGLASETEAIGKTDIEIYKDTERNIGYQEDLMVLYNGEPIINNTGQLICNDGKTRDTAVTKVPLKDEQGNVYGLVGICRDITEEKKLLEEYYKEKQLLRTLIDNLPFSIFVKDDKARKLIANKLDIEFMGLKSEAEALGKTDFEIFGDIERNHGFEEDMEVIGEGKSVIDSDNLVIDKNGNISNWLVTKLPLKDENGTTYGLVGICRDVTEEKKLVEQLKLVDFAFRNSAVPMHFIKEDGSILDCNKAACALLGYTQEEYLSKTIFDFNKNNTKEVFKEFWKNFSNNSDKPTYLSLTNKNNKLNVVEARANKIVYGKIELMCSSFIDITENLKIENQLKLVDFAFRESSIPIFFIEEDGTLLNINNAAIELYGYTEDEMRGMKVRMVSATQSDEIYQKQFDNIWRIIKEKGRHLIITKHKKKNGEILDIEINFNYIEFGGKKLNCAFLKDITEKREAEIEKEHLLSELIQSNMELKQFSYITTHNLRAPLTNLISICNIINTKTISDRVTLNLIDGFKSSTHQLNNTLNDLIDILIIKENINLPTGRVFFQNTLDKVKASLLNTLLKENVVIEAHFEEATSVCFSSIYLESVLLNLLTNSIKYHHPNRNPIIKIDTKKDGDGNTIMTFTDNGIGMDMKRVKDKIFGLYQRFHGNSNSKGIGLYLIHSQITALKGKIEVTSEVNVGTTFTVTFR